MSKENCRDSWIGIWGLKHSFPGRFVKELQTTLLILQGSIAFKRSIKIPIKEQVSFWLFFYLLLFSYTEVFKQQIEQVCIPVGCVPPALVATTTCQYQGVRTIHPSGWRPSPGWRPPPLWMQSPQKEHETRQPDREWHHIPPSGKNIGLGSQIGSDLIHPIGRDKQV